MGLEPASGIFLIVPISLILALSFFVIYLNSKVQNRPLRVYGWVVIVFLWVSAGIFAGAGIFSVCSGGTGAFPGCPFSRSSGCVRGFHGGKYRPAHKSMMKYHRYDEQGNIIIDKPAAAQKEAE